MDRSPLICHAQNLRLPRHRERPARSEWESREGGRCETDMRAGRLRDGESEVAAEVKPKEPRKRFHSKGAKPPSTKRCCMSQSRAASFRWISSFDEASCGCDFVCQGLVRTMPKITPAGSGKGAAGKGDGKNGSKGDGKNQGKGDGKHGPKDTWGQTWKAGCRLSSCHNHA